MITRDIYSTGFGQGEFHCGGSIDPGLCGDRHEFHLVSFAIVRANLPVVVLIYKNYSGFGTAKLEKNQKNLLFFSMLA
jgi:hypothetical protein